MSRGVTPDMAIRTDKLSEAESTSESAGRESDGVVGDASRIAPPYQESKTQIDPSTLTVGLLVDNTVEITYRTQGDNQKTVRCRHATGPNPENDVPEQCVEFQYTDEKNVEYDYRYDTKTHRLRSVGRYRLHTVAQTDDILNTKVVQYPQPVPVYGVVQEGVETTVYYRSPRTDRIQELSVFVQTVTEDGSVIKGERADGRSVVAHTNREREILVDTEQGRKRIGKVAAVEFPKGHEYAIQVEGLKDNEATDRTTQRIQKAIQSALCGTDTEVDVEVDHVGRLNS